MELLASLRHPPALLSSFGYKALSLSTLIDSAVYRSVAWVLQVQLLLARL